MPALAKYKVTGRTETASDGFQINLTPSSEASPENDDFFQPQPGGTLQLSGVANDVAAQFTPGSTFFVLFTKETA